MEFKIGRSLFDDFNIICKRPETFSVTEITAFVTKDKIFKMRNTNKFLLLSLQPVKALVLWLWEETHVPKVVGSNPSTVPWMDIFHKYLL